MVRRLIPLTIVAVTVFAARSPAAEKPGRTVTVSGRSEVRVAPDLAVLDLEIATEERQLLLSKRENDRRTAAVTAVARKHGLAGEEVRVASLDVEPVYVNRDRRTAGTLIGYEFDRRLELRVRDFAALEPLLSDALAAGATGVGGLSFVTTKHREQQFEARRLAVEHAREKAAHLAALNGLTLGKAVEIEEGVEGGWNTEGFGGAIGVGSADAPIRPAIAKATPPADRFVADVPDAPADGPPAADPAAGPAAATAFAPGELVIEATVTITFELVDPPAADPPAA